MVFVDESLDEMLGKTRTRTLVKDETLIPSRRPDIFYPEEDDPEMIMIKDPYVQKLGEFARRYESPIWELISNAVNRGNNGDWNKPITIKVWGSNISSRGSVLRIEDVGPGFDYVSYLNEWLRFMAKNAPHNLDSPESPWQGEGLGFRKCFVEPRLYVSYEGAGNIVNVRSNLGV